MDDWWEYSRTLGFPIMRRQPGLRGIYRLKNLKEDGAFAYLTIWDSIEDLDRFKASADMILATTKGEGLTIRPSTEWLFEYLPDDEDSPVLLGEEAMQKKSGPSVATKP
jgi:heme-degrading monooxygenase HmoA